MNLTINLNYSIIMNINDLIQKRVEDSKEEIVWLPIKNIDGYLINQFGQVKSLKRVVPRSDGRAQLIHERILRFYKNDKCQCLQISLCINSIPNIFCIRKLVAESFNNIDRGDKSIFIIHKDGDFTNCYFKNLRAYNANEYRTKILNKYNISSKRKVIATNGGEQLEFDSVLEASQHFGKAYKTLQCKVGTQSRVDGYILEYGDLI